MNSERLKQQAQDHRGSVPGPLGKFLFSFLMECLSVRTSESLIFVTHF